MKIILSKFVSIHQTELRFLKKCKDQLSSQEIFQEIFSIQGELYREQKGRRTIRFQAEGQYYFAKIHEGVGWWEIIKNLMNLKFPVISARNEWRAIRQFEKSGIPTTPLVCYGRRGINPAKMKSFIVTKEIRDCVSLEEYCREWNKNPPPFYLKRELIKKVASLIKKMHESGMNHRDLYLCHFLLAPEKRRERQTLYLIDLHRVQIRPRVPLRWKIKDLGGLLFSAMDLGLTQRDLLRFIRYYEGRSIKECFMENKRFWDRVRNRAIAMYNKINR